MLNIYYHYFIYNLAVKIIYFRNNVLETLCIKNY